MKQASAFAPCHITGIFEIFDQSGDALHIGSRGAGVTLNLGVKTTVTIKERTKHRLLITINGRKPESAHVSKHVVDTFLARYSGKIQFEIKVEHWTDAPIGSGFGTSGAAALSLSLALNKALDIGMSRVESANVAHVAEIECGTGLGTVAAETIGGFEIRTEPGAPGTARIMRLPVSDNIRIICHVFGPLSTNKYLADEDTRIRINKFGGRLIHELIEAPTIEDFMKLSREFAENVGLITERVRRVFDAADKARVICSMPMFGEAAFTAIDRDRAESISDIFRRNSSSGCTMMSEISQDGARLLP